MMQDFPQSMTEVLSCEKILLDVLQASEPTEVYVWQLVGLEVGVSDALLAICFAVWGTE